MSLGGVFNYEAQSRLWQGQGTLPQQLGGLWLACCYRDLENFSGGTPSEQVPHGTATLLV